MLSMKENSGILKHEFLDKKVLECSNSKFNVSYHHIQELHNDVLSSPGPESSPVDLSFQQNNW